jgi:hypothetical protein
VIRCEATFRYAIPFNIYAAAPANRRGSEHEFVAQLPWGHAPLKYAWGLYVSLLESSGIEIKLRLNARIRHQGVKLVNIFLKFNRHFSHVTIR